jgi:hypothetical protein
MVVPVPVCGNPLVRDIFSHVVVMEIILAWLWLIGIVAFLVLCKGVNLVGLIV